MKTKIINGMKCQQYWMIEDIEVGYCEDDGCYYTSDGRRFLSIEEYDKFESQTDNANED